MNKHKESRIVLITLILIIIQLALVPAAFAGWTELTSPTSNNLNGLYFSDVNTGYVVGNSGTIYRTTNGGTGWTDQSTGTDHVYDISIPPDAGETDYSYENFSAYTENDPNPATVTVSRHSITIGGNNNNHKYVSMDFGTGHFSDSAGFTHLFEFIVSPSQTNTNWTCPWVMDNGIYALENLGDGYSLCAFDTKPVSQGKITFEFCNNDISTGNNCTRKTSGRVLAGTRIYAKAVLVPGDQIYMYLYSDAARTTLIDLTPNPLVRGIDSQSYRYLLALTNNTAGKTKRDDMTIDNMDILEETGYASRSNGDVLRTTSTGTVWSPDTAASSTSLNDVHFVDLQTGWTVGNSCTIKKTTDNGGTWTDQTPSGCTDTLDAVFMLDANTGWAVGASGRLLRTTNGGTAWNSCTDGSCPSENLHDVYFVSSTTGWVVGASGAIYKSTNGGSVWTDQSIAYHRDGQWWYDTTEYFGVYFLDANTGFAVGENDVIIRTKDSGSSWYNYLAPTSGETFKEIVMVNATTGYIVGTGGTILKTTDGGGITAVDLVSFDAIGISNEVLIRWKTASEINNAGYNIFRSTSEDGEYIQINSSLITGLTNSSLGREYEFTDPSVTSGAVYYYKLEDINLDGKRTIHGPVTARPGLDSDGDGMTDDWEEYYGLDPYNAADAELDSDNDGITNIEEYLAGTDPFRDENMVTTTYVGGAVRIIESNDHHIVMELVTPSFETEEKTANGETFQSISIPDYTHGYTDRKGSPQLPEKGVLVGIPQGTNPRLRIIGSTVDVLDGYNIYPVPKMREDSEQEPPVLVEEFYRNNSAYTRDFSYPQTLAEISYTGRQRSQNIARVVFHPFQYNPAGGNLTFNKTIRVELLFNQKKANPGWKRRHAKLPYTGNPELRISITEEGMYSLGWDDLYNAGMTSPDAIDPRTFKLYNRGDEIAILVEGEQDGWFDQGDEIVFYAEAFNSKYSSTNVYWLTYDSSSGLRMQENPGSTEEPLDTYFECPSSYHMEKDEFYWHALKGADNTDRWLIGTFVWGGSQGNFDLSLAGVSAVPDYEATVRLALRGIYDTSLVPYHHAIIYLNGHMIADTQWGDTLEQFIEVDIPQQYLVEGNNTITVEAMLDTGAEFDVILTDWIELDYMKELYAVDNTLTFADQSLGTYSFEIPGFTAEPEIYDITDPANVQYVTNFQYADGTVSFSDDVTAGKEYTATDRTLMKKPLAMEIDDPSDLDNTENQADYLIITAEDFYNDVMPLANFRDQKGLRTKVVRIQDVYDEFGSGIESPHAVKDFLTYTYIHWQKPAPTYVLLVGDASYDYKDNYGFGKSNYVPTFMVMTPYTGETGSDDWFVLLDGNDDKLGDMFIGRIPARTSGEVQAVINKTIAYEQTSLDEAEQWANRVIFVADEDIPDFEESSDNLAGLLPDTYSSAKLYLSYYDDPPSLTQDIISEVNQGALMLNYTGHGSVELWSSSNILNRQDINAMSNAETLPVVVSMTCLDGFYLHPHIYDSMAETFLKNAYGGAVASWSPTSMGETAGHAILNEGLYRAIFEDHNNILGSAISQAKSALLLQSGDTYLDLIQTYTLFGDPALQLKVRTDTDLLEPVFDDTFKRTIKNFKSSKNWKDTSKRSAKKNGVE